MELTLSVQADSVVAVQVDGAPSHTFELHRLAPGMGDPPLPQPVDDPIAYGQAVYAALFPAGSVAAAALRAEQARILLVADDALQPVAWEYAHDGEAFLALDLWLVRGLPAAQRQPAPVLDAPLHVIAVPSAPLHAEVPPLLIEEEWGRLAEEIERIGQERALAVTLERCRPATLARLRDLVAGRQGRVLHFMGHGGQFEEQARLLFENEDGSPAAESARNVARTVRGSLFLAVLNACVSATPGPTEFANLAQALVARGMPYALGMRFSVLDDDARRFSRVFYADLARGAPVEEALRQARIALAGGDRAWAVGAPVLYTGLDAPAAGFAQPRGQAQIVDPRPPVEISTLPAVDGLFRGRTAEMVRLGNALTGDARPRILTIHGGGGQGKTALARQAADRFAYAWPGGVWAISLETLPDRRAFVTQTAALLGVGGGDTLDVAALERALRARLAHQRTLLVLDNAETLLDALHAGDAAARDLALLLRELPADGRTTLLVTSRILLEWPGEVGVSLGGLTPAEGAQLFRQYAGSRGDAVEMALARQLSQQVDGHPLSLRLLGGAFAAGGASLAAFVAAYAEELVAAQDIYRAEDHRHRSLYAAIETSVRALDDELRELLSRLWVFEGWFWSPVASAILSGRDDGDDGVAGQLHQLWRRGLLARQERTLRDGEVTLYRLLPSTRPYVAHVLAADDAAKEPLRARYGAAYADLARRLYRGIDSSAALVHVAQQATADLEAALAFCEGLAAARYHLHWGWVLGRLGNPVAGLRHTEAALSAAEGIDQRLTLEAINNMAGVYYATGQPQQALTLYQQALPIRREVGDRSGEAATLNNMAMVYSATGQPQQALTLYQQALPIRREVGDRRGEATTLNNMAGVYYATGQPQQALTLFQQALPIRREVGDRAGEAATLNNMAGVYYATGQPQQALTLFQQALPIRREVGDRAGEATTLNNMALVYRATGQPQQALTLYQQALPIMREVGDRAGEATTLNNMALVYRATGQPQQALTLYQQALPMLREVGDRAGEATTLNNMAMVYDATGQPQQALTLYQQALPITREVGNRAGEATTLNNMAGVYQATGQPQQALTLYQQALPITREVGDRAGEATTLNNMAGVYQATGQPQQALTLYQQALPITREVGDRAGEATTLNNMAGVYRATGQPQQALTLYQQALPIRREVGDRAGEATTLNNMAGVYQATGQPQQALTLYQQALPIMREVGDRAGEATTLNNMAGVYQATGQPQQALDTLKDLIALARAIHSPAIEAGVWSNIASVLLGLQQFSDAVEAQRQAVAVMEKYNLSHTAGGSSLAEIKAELARLESGSSPQQTNTAASTLPPQVQQTLIHNTVAVLTEMPEQREEWRSALANSLQEAQSQGEDWRIEVEMFTALLALLDGDRPTLPADHAYRRLLDQVLAALGAVDAPAPPSPAAALPADFVVRCAGALGGDPSAKLAFFGQLERWEADHPSHAALFHALRTALFLPDPSALDPELTGEDAALWAQIVGRLA